MRPDQDWLRLHLAQGQVPDIASLANRLARAPCCSRRFCASGAVDRGWPAVGAALARADVRRRLDVSSGRPAAVGHSTNYCRKLKSKRDRGSYKECIN
eukprot:6179041-Pleurochrysis_carterae.AAC.4